MLAEQTTLDGLLTDVGQLLIPLYQRPYSWTDGDLNRLWADILKQADLLRVTGRASHYLGSVVLAPVPGPASGKRWIVVDGQQRLTTLMLALCAIRDHRALEEPDHRRRINDRYLINNKPLDQRYRLLPTQLDREEFERCVMETRNDRSAGLIADAYGFFQRKLKEAEVEAPVYHRRVEHIETVILSHLRLMQISIEEDKGDNAFQIFESINNTGRPLSQVDLIRNYVFLCLPKRGQDIYERLWLPAQRLLGTKGFDHLMRLVLVLEGISFDRAEVYRGHQELLRGVSHDEDSVEQYVHDLGVRARHLHQILSPDLGTAVGVRISFLNEFKATTAHALIMRLLELKEQHEVDSDEVAETLQHIESFVVRRHLTRISSGPLNRVFRRLAQDLSPDQPIAETVRAELSRASLAWPSDEELRRSIEEKPFYQEGPRLPQQKIILMRLERTYPSRERVDITSKDITLEHVLPQSPGHEWLTALAEGGGDPHKLHRKLVHTLGNITLTGHNSELGNSSFEEKRKVFSVSGLAMNQAIAQQERWGEAEIKARAADLSKRAIELWPGPDESCRETAPPPDWAPLTTALSALPPATWVSYGDLAAAIGCHILPLRAHLDRHPILNGHRVLTADGTPPDADQSMPRSELRQRMQPLIDDGIAVDGLSRAVTRQRITTGDLGAILGVTCSGSVDLGEEHRVIGAAQRTFLERLGEASGLRGADAVQRLLDYWGSTHGHVRYGAASCTAVLNRDHGTLVPMRFYPGKVEIPFRELLTKAPFDDLACRQEFLKRLNGVPGVDIPGKAISRAPSFPTALLADVAMWDMVQACLDWFRGRVEEGS
ncbi:DUF262 domain-containing protein [Nonomuraea sp. NPDC046802]|uniref:DUF262 domain-containing protein n=1 Tax=Nonomuraea sp. NPDC046802 TaxID=3154919 RepID=UPI00340AAFA6